MRTSSPFILLSLAWAASACAPARPAQSAEAGPDTSVASPSSDGEASAAQKPKGPAADVLYVAPQAVPAAPDSCVGAGPLPPRAKCDEARPKLAEALAKDGTALDAALAELEACEEFPAGLLRALRAELGEAECADKLVAPVVGEGTDASAMTPDIREALVALGLGARLRRLAANPPPAPKDAENEELQAYYKDELFPWAKTQAHALFAMASQGTALSGYARGVVAIEAGNADMRWVEIAREAPISEAIKKDQVATDQYYADLDQLLEPRKARGRNAALVGLREMARVGVRQSARVSSARTLLSRAYGGRRVNALDTLLVAHVAPEKAATDAAGIASRVPTAYATILVGDAPLSANLVRAHLQQGMTLALERAVTAMEGHAGEKLLLARALFERGRTYFRAADFQAAQALLAPLLDQPADKSGLSLEQLDEAVMLRALSVALVAGPKDAAEMIAKGPRFADQLGNLVLLEGLGSMPGVLGGQAAFNSAYLRELVAPAGSPDYWTDLASRYGAASQKLRGEERRVARDRSKACREIAQSVRQQLKTAGSKSAP